MSSLPYTFLPWVRQGMTGVITVEDSLDENITNYISLPVSLKITTNELNEKDVYENRNKPKLRFYGPGDITDIDQRQIIRTDPPHLTTDFEPYYFPSIEFDRPDFPWLFTPAAANSEDKLRPWICLVVVCKDKVTLSHNHIVLKCPRGELPDLKESWAWAHAQIIGDSANIGEIDKGLTLSRLVCPRKLEPNSQYYACLVPTFKAGLDAGLGLKVDYTKLIPAWSSEDLDKQIEIPIYYYWEFSTGEAHDFESLVRELLNNVNKELPAGVGTRRVDISSLQQIFKNCLNLEIPDMDNIVDIEGALLPARSEFIQWNENAQEALRKLVNPPQAAKSKTVGPPIYGGIHAATDMVAEKGGKPYWLRDLNIDPRYRIAAALGTLVVQDQQDQLMASAWEQIANIKSANQVILQSQLAVEVSTKISDKHLKNMNIIKLLQIAGPAHQRLKDSPFTISKEVSMIGLPKSLFSTSTRIVSRPKGPIGHRIQQLGRIPQQIQITKKVAEKEILVVTPHTLPERSKIVALNKETLIVDDDKIDELIQDKNLQKAIRIHRSNIEKGWGLAEKAINEFEEEKNKPFLKNKDELIKQLDPTTTIPARLHERVKIIKSTAENSVSTRSFTNSQGPTSDQDLITYEPKFPHPMYEALRDLSQDLLLPGIEHAQPNTIALLQTNSRFIEAYLVGLNHEMSRELLWREYPANLRGTYFQHFWENLSKAQEGINPVHEWDSSKCLGQNLVGSSMDNRLVLLLRSDLLRRYPDAIIYALEAAWEDTVDPQKRVHTFGVNTKLPIFQGTLKPDISFLGFDLTVEEAKGDDSNRAGWFIVIEQRPTQPRFGLDKSDSTGKNNNNLSWSYIEKKDCLDEGNYIRISDFLKDKSLKLDNETLGGNSAQIASITLQKPFRVFIHASVLLS